MDTTTDLGIRIQCVTVDAHDPARLARFWSRALGWRVTDEDDEESVIEPPEGARRTRWRPTSCSSGSLRASRSRTVCTSTCVPTTNSRTSIRLLALGATRADVGQTGEERWVVLAGPEGNEFCVLAPRANPS